jgi:hypothetical protein
VAKIATLIDKSDTCELVRDQIAAILVTESEQQQQLARDAGKEPDLWKLRVFTERSNPWDEFPKELANDGSDNFSPIVNVCWDTSQDDEKASNVVGTQKCDGTFNVDCYGAAVSIDTADGHAPGDREAAFEAQRAARLVRNILMAGPYTYLDMRPTVVRRWRASSQAFQPQMGDHPTTHVQAVRHVFKVSFAETSPQTEGVPVSVISLTVKRSENGQVLLQADFPQES